MALFLAYTPEPDELDVLVRHGAPDVTGEELFDREDAVTAGFFRLQAYCSRNPGNERYLSRPKGLELAQPWVLDALCVPLPNRPALLHTPGGPGTMCRIEGCLDRCLDESCDCTIGAWQEGADFRLCLMR
ncbi:MAG TPA: hypothetical protein VGP26_24680 [Actinophytocola sp.]|jgi:hypothetical protein|nr:hypothetical protein [Actinophytocola sp.]